MIKKTGIWVSLFSFLYVLSSVSMAGDGDRRHHNTDMQAFANSGGQTSASSTPDDFKRHHHDQDAIAVKLLGWSTAYTPGSGDGLVDSVPNVEGDVVCQDVEMVDLITGEHIATSSDCFSDVEMDMGGGAGFVGTSFLRFPEGTLISQGQFTAQPVLRPTVSIDGVEITALTSAATDGNSIIGGTGVHENSTANVRVSGMINGTGYMFMPGDTMFFDCIFVIQPFYDSDSDESDSDDDEDS